MVNLFYLMYFKCMRWVSIGMVLLMVTHAEAQLASVRFGKNRMQFTKWKWRTIDMDRFDFYYHDTTGSFAAELSYHMLTELLTLENKMNFRVPNKFNVIYYPSYEEYIQSNIGMRLDWYSKDIKARFINNKIPIYYSSSTKEIKEQIKEGIMRLIIEYLLTGKQKGDEEGDDKIGLYPSWFLKGYVKYRASGWTTELDYQMRSRIADNRYKKFNHLLGAEPYLAGVLLWYYFDRKYGKMDEVLQVMIYSKGINSVFQRIIKKRYKEMVSDIIPYFQELYNEDERKRKDNAKGQSFVRVPLHKPNTFGRVYDVHSIIANPATKKGIYARVDYKEGRSKVIVSETRSRKKTILKTGVYLYDNTVTEHYPLIAWSPNGTRLGVVYFNKQQVDFFEYDILRHTKVRNINMSEHFTAIHDFQYFNDQGRILLSAVREGQSDAFFFDLNTLKTEPITNDIYDNIDVSYVTFGKKTGIIFASNRPVSIIDSLKGDSEKEEDNHNIFIADYAVADAPHPISPLTFLTHGDARYPSQFNNQSFSYISDENGIHNRYIADVVSEPKGLDKFYTVNKKIYKNISTDSLNVLLKQSHKSQADKVQLLTKTEEKTRHFPISNYKNDIIESKYVGGLHPMLTDLKYTIYSKQLYQVPILDQKEESTLHLPPLTPTAFRLFQKGIISINKKDGGKAKKKNPLYELFNPVDKDTIAFYQHYFLSEFAFNPLFNVPRPNLNDNFSDPNESSERLRSLRKSLMLIRVQRPKGTLSSQTYLRRFFLDNVSLDLNNSLLAGQIYQPYAGGTGPIFLNGQGRLLGMFTVNALENLEDMSLTLGYRIPLSFNTPTSDFIASFNYLKYRTDIGFTYLRTVQTNQTNTLLTTNVTTRTITNYYLFHFTYPLDILRSIRIDIGPRRDFFNYKLTPQENGYIRPDSISWIAQMRVEYIYDNVIHPTVNVWKGLRYKIYSELFFNIGRYNVIDVKRNNVFNFDQNIFSIGFDARYYKAIYKNIVWATRFSGDFSFGKRRILYYLGGTDGWYLPKFNNANKPDPTINYAFQTLALNLRGFKQNEQNGSRNLVLNTELRVPIFASIFNRPISNDFLRHFTFTTFIDMGTAWEGDLPKPPVATYATDNSVVSVIQSPLPFAMGYGIGFRTRLFGYFIKIDRAYPVGSKFFTGGMWYFSLEYDF